MNLGHRPLSVWLTEFFRPRNYSAVARMVRLTPRPVENLRRFLTLGGDYPYEPAVRTPTGVVAPTLHGFDDMMTFNEIFIREDYRCPPDAQVVVDIGSNIGISALYFLTRNPKVRCWLYEPVPANIERLKHNLRNHVGRYELREAAVGVQTGPVTFNVEPSGRYGGIGVDTDQSITVSCSEVNAVLAEVFERESHIDVLKLDIEGLEIDVLRAIEPRHLERIKVIYVEWQDGDLSLFPELFDSKFFNDTYRLSCKPV